MRPLVLILLLVVLAGCTSLDVRPIPASAHLEKVCIKHNDDNNVGDLEQVLQEGFSSHGISTNVVKDNKQVLCPAVATYTADRWWDMAPYMVDAKVTVENDAGFLGSLHYHLAGHGGLDLTKWEGTHAKLDPAIDAMLVNYPKGEHATPTANPPPLPSQTPSPQEKTIGMTIDECFKKCRELTSQTESQCFDKCRH